MKRQRGLPNHPGSRSLFIIITLLTMVETIAIIAQAVHLATAISSLFEGAALVTQIPRILLFFLMFILRHGITFIKRSLAQRHATKTATMIRKDLLTNVEKLGKEYITRQETRKTNTMYRKYLLTNVEKHEQAYISREGTEKTVTLSIEGIKQIETYLHITIPRMFQAVIVPAGIVMYVWFIHRTSAYILVGVI